MTFPISWRHLARELAPPALLRTVRALRAAEAAPQPFREYSSWEEAVAHAGGYDAEDILARVEAATRKVVAGEAACERDSVTFDRIDHSFPVLAVLLAAATENNGSLHVLDFGGSLGSSYRQCRGFLRGVRELRWNILEQPNFVRCGQAAFETDELRFRDSVAAASEPAPAVVLVSSSLQYVPDPHTTLARLRDTATNYLILDRIPMTDEDRDRVVVQRVPPSIYPASYPCWLLSRAALLATMGAGWELLAQFPSAIDSAMPTDRGPVPLGGMIFRRACARVPGEQAS